MINIIWFIFYSELILLLRRSQEWLYPLGFFLIVMSLFPLAFTPDPDFLKKYVPGCIWIAALLASLLSMQLLFSSDLEDGGLEQLIISPIPLTLLIAPKLLAQWLATSLPLILLSPLLGLMFNISFNIIGMICLSLLIGTPILTLIGGLGMALTLGLRQQGMLLGLLILPLVTPVLILGVSMTQQMQSGFSSLTPTILLMALLVLALTLIPVAISSSLKMSVEN